MRQREGSSPFPLVLRIALVSMARGRFGSEDLFADLRCSSYKVSAHPLHQRGSEHTPSARIRLGRSRGRSHCDS